MQPYQERVVVEYNELCEKLDKLTKFIDKGIEQTNKGSVFDAMDVVDQSLLLKQFNVMTDYRNILSERISRFKE